MFTKASLNAICVTNHLKTLRHLGNTKSQFTKRTNQILNAHQRLATSTCSKIIIGTLAVIFFQIIPRIAEGQTEHTQFNSDSITVFVGFIIAVIALGLYIARDAILRKKTDYDDGEFASKKNREHEKYSSKWQDDYVDPVLQTKHDVNHYDTLGLESSATEYEIKMRYRELAKEHHPDRTGGDSDKLIKINEAYETLSNSKLRKKYDESLY